MIPPFTLRDSGEVWGSIFIGSIFLLIASVVVWTIRHELRVRRWLRDEPLDRAQAKGHIISIQSAGSETARIEVRYRFADAVGQMVEGMQAFAQLGFPEALRQADAITIIYNPGYPALNYIDGYRENYCRVETHYITGFIIMGLFLLGFFLLAGR